MDNVLNKTGQSWKFTAFLIALLIFGFCIIAGGFFRNEISNNLFFVLVAGGSMAGLFSFFLACYSIKCPNCGLKWFWAAVSKNNKNEWLFWLRSLRSCPKCGEPKVE